MKNLLFFYGLECPHCVAMESLVDKLLSEGFPVIKLETWHNKENEEKMVGLDKGSGMCGGVPFFFNENNQKTLCGEVKYEELKDWAMGK